MTTDKAGKLYSRRKLEEENETLRSREKELMAALKECLNDYQAAYDVQAVVSSVTGKNNAERMAAGVRCDTILMPRIAKLRSLLGDEAQAQKGGER